MKVNKMEQELKPNRCFCGGSVCVCATEGHWRIHCQDCDWSFGGSTLEINNDEQEVIKEWNRRTGHEK